VRIDIISDVVCPWCFIGSRHLERALQLRAEADPAVESPEIHWHPFQLNPTLPAGGMPRKEYIEAKFGGPERANQIYARVKDAGLRAGIALDFDRILVQPNTLDAHRLIHRASSMGIQDAMVESLFRGYFLEGRDLTRIEVLAELAERAGMPRAQSERYLASEEDRDTVEEADRHARRIGVEGVPFFIFNRRIAVSGAQPPELLLDAIAQATAVERSAAAQ
jgi:predicted DsbA family dithiol-disulfide isomerase